MDFKKMFFVWLTLTLSVMIAWVLFVFSLKPKELEEKFKADKSIVVVENSYLNDSEKTELIEKAKVNGYELKMLGKDEYIFEKTTK